MLTQEFSDRVAIVTGAGKGIGQATVPFNAMYHATKWALEG